MLLFVQHLLFDQQLLHRAQGCLVAVDRAIFTLWRAFKAAQRVKCGFTECGEIARGFGIAWNVAARVCTYAAGGCRENAVKAGVGARHGCRLRL